MDSYNLAITNKGVITMGNTANISTNENTVETVETQNTEEVKTYTQDEVLALLQSETDKRVTAALKTQQKKYEKQLSLTTYKVCIDISF